MANPPAIILGGSSNAVSVTRSLARAGVAVHALGDPAKQVRWSRYLHEFVPMRGPDVQDRTLEWLATAGPRAGVVLPCDDEGLELVARRRDALVALGYTPTEHADEVLLAMLDKERTYELAHAAGVETPFTTTVRAGDAAAAPDGLAYPCAVKPLQSHVFARHLPGVKALIAAGEADLRRHLELTGSLGVDAMITEIVPGPESAFCSYYSYLDERGEPLFHYTRHKLRQHPLPFGLASYATNDEQPEAERIGERFFRAAGLRGLGNVEFKRDARDGRLKLIECNSRFTAADRHLWLCGLDLPAFVYNRLLGRALPPMETRRFGVRFWHPLQDTTTFLAGRRAGALTLRSWVRSLAHRQHFPVADVRDPMPTVGHHAQLVARIAKDAARARRARR